MNKQHHILVIDDNPDLLMMLGSMLKIKGYQVTLKENVDDIESEISKLSPDVIMMDMLLSGADGRDVCRLLKSKPHFSGIPLIMLSAHPQAKGECLAAGSDDFIAKPFEMNHLLQTLAIYTR